MLLTGRSHSRCLGAGGFSRSCSWWNWCRKTLRGPLEHSLVLLAIDERPGQEADHAGDEPDEAEGPLVLLAGRVAEGVEGQEDQREADEAAAGPGTVERGGDAGPVEDAHRPRVQAVPEHAGLHGLLQRGPEVAGREAQGLGVGVGVGKVGLAESKAGGKGLALLEDWGGRVGGQGLRFFLDHLSPPRARDRQHDKCEPREATVGLQPFEGLGSPCVSVVWA